VGAVYQPLLTAFGPSAIESRLAMSGVKLVVTDPADRPKLDEVDKAPPIAVIGAAREGDLDFDAELEPGRLGSLRAGGAAHHIVSTRAR
jgi:acetyl-CoA synthetase